MESSQRCIAVEHGGSSNTTRSRKYNDRSCGTLDLSDFRNIVSIDADAWTAVVEPRATMEELAAATLARGFMPPVVPELKGITVGGAISGGATESSGWKYGAFHDVCLGYEILLGNGEVIRASASENPDIFYGYPSSYGSLGPLLSCTMQLQPACTAVALTYHCFQKPLEALDWMRQRVHAPDAADFLDGMIFSKDLAVIIEGRKLFADDKTPLFSMKKLGAEWYYQHVRELAERSCVPRFEEKMDVQEYFFRYDTGAFWMGAYVFSLPLIFSYLFHGLRSTNAPPNPRISEAGYASLSRLNGPGFLSRAALSRWFSSSYLWKLEHAAEKWVHDLMVIQDFCFPEDRAAAFLAEVVSGTNIFPLWLCPIRATRNPGIFCPHVQEKPCHVINVGIYGLAPGGESAPALTRSLERAAAPSRREKGFV